MTLNQELLAEIVPILAKKMEAWDTETGEFEPRAHRAWQERRRAADDRIVEFFTTRYDAAFTRPSSDYAVRMAGIRATSTSGWINVLHNWRRAAEKKLAAGTGVVHRDGFNPHGSGPVPIEPREG